MSNIGQPRSLHCHLHNIRFFDVSEDSTPDLRCIECEIERADLAEAALTCRPEAPMPKPLAWLRMEDGIRVYYETKAWPNMTPLYEAPVSATPIPCSKCGKTPPFPGGTRCQDLQCPLINWAGRGDDKNGEMIQAALNYIKHVGANWTMRGEPHPQQWIVDGLERILATPSATLLPEEARVLLIEAQSELKIIASYENDPASNVGLRATAQAYRRVIGKISDFLNKQPRYVHSSPEKADG